MQSIQNDEVFRLYDKSTFVVSQPITNAQHFLFKQRKENLIMWQKNISIPCMALPSTC